MITAVALAIGRNEEALVCFLHESLGERERARAGFDPALDFLAP
jgi:hypothetical protein